MTAEVAIMNKSAIALAADSAVTIGRKIYNSVNKLYTLSKFQPVGIMIYGNASLLEIPWETIIKIFRQNISDKKFPKLENYANEFINFLDNGNTLFPISEQKEYLIRVIENFFSNLIEDLDLKVRESLKKKKSIDDNLINTLMEDVIEEHHDIWSKIENLPNFGDDFDEKFLKKYSTEINKIIKRNFPKFNFQKKVLDKLKELSIYLFKKDNFLLSSSGIVIAGFGEKDIFPSVVTYQIEGIIINKLKYKLAENLSNNITYDNSATIIPFAQGDMVATFVEGVDPFYNQKMFGFLEELFLKIYPTSVLDSINIKDKKVKDETLKKLKEFDKKIFEDFIKKMDKHRQEFHVVPIINAVAVLPKDELALMAESLVNLTSLKRKISLDSAETVGGPIDVAVISKGDGFVWIKRKHYFKSELNPHFIRNYYQ